MSLLLMWLNLEENMELPLDYEFYCNDIQYSIASRRFTHDTFTQTKKLARFCLTPEEHLAFVTIALLGRASQR